MKKERMDELEELLGEEFRPDFLARVQGKILFRADAASVSEGKLETLMSRLLERGFIPHLERRDGELLLFVFPSQVKQKTPRLWINALLFVLTILSTLAAGAMLIGKDILADVSLIGSGWRYSFAVLFILTSHEMGHYLAARWHKINVTLPYYIPIFIPGFNLGTMGAFIKIRSPIPNRRALIDVGVAGPLAGFVVSLFFLAYGYYTLPPFEGIVAYVETIHPWQISGQGVNLTLGKSLLFTIFNDWIGGGRLPMNEVYHFPYIFAGWIGLLVTAINLIPIGQLDGGHILYALVGRNARRIGILSFLALLLLNFYLIYEYFSLIWVLWIILILVLIGFKHPPTLNDYMALTPARMYLGWLCMIIFVFCFIPMPIYIA